MLRKFDTGAINQNDLRNNVSYLEQKFLEELLEKILFLIEMILKNKKLLMQCHLLDWQQYSKNSPTAFHLIYQKMEGIIEVVKNKYLHLPDAWFQTLKVILLDEPTSAMDPRHENLFIKQMESYTRDKTFIVVTHRRPILALTNRIIVIEQGKIILDGQRDEVLKKFK